MVIQISLDLDGERGNVIRIMRRPLAEGQRTRSGDGGETLSSTLGVEIRSLSAASRRFRPSLATVSLSTNDLSRQRGALCRPRWVTLKGLSPRACPTGPQSTVKEAEWSWPPMQNCSSILRLEAGKIAAFCRGSLNWSVPRRGPRNDAVKPAGSGADKSVIWSSLGVAAGRSRSS